MRINRASRSHAKTGFDRFLSRLDAYVAQALADRHWLCSPRRSHWGSSAAATGCRATGGAAAGNGGAATGCGNDGGGRNNSPAPPVLMHPHAPGFHITFEYSRTGLVTLSRGKMHGVRGPPHSDKLHGDTHAIAFPIIRPRLVGEFCPSLEMEKPRGRSV